MILHSSGTMGKDALSNHLNFGVFYPLQTFSFNKKIDFTKTYPDGTLLLQNYSAENAGHVAIVLKSSKKGLLDSKIIHNVGGIFKEKKYREVVIELLKDYPDYKRFTHVCLPENWLLKN